MAKKKPVITPEALKRLGAGAAMADRPLAPEEPLNESSEAPSRRRKEIVADRRFQMLFREPDFEALEANALMKGLSTGAYIKMILSEAGAFNLPPNAADK